MDNVKGLLAAGLVAATTAACADPYGYSGYNTGYTGSGYSTGYSRPYSSSAYYGGSRSYSPGYVYAAPTVTTYQTPQPSRYGARGDYDRDGVPNKYDRDANGDGMADRYQR